MKRFILVFAVIALCTHAFAQDVSQDKEAIKKVIQTAYVDGLQNEGDMAKIDSGIHPDFKLLGIGEENKMWDLPIDKWKESTEKKKAEGKLPRTGKDMVSVIFESIDVTGTAAVAKIQFYVGDTLTYVDYIALYKFPEGWKMVNKIFYKFPK